MFSSATSINLGIKLRTTIFIKSVWTFFFNVYFFTMTVIVTYSVPQPLIVPSKSLGLRKESLGNRESGNESIFMGISCCFLHEEMLIG